ncbi:helix-turn-helix domain-containing protein [Desulfosporosinus sp. SB140]|uniref:helix-turn-helix domain-containing protein n=1 Tax=Desulfosporosinus paludis TaxID=3115649 RepID=UPI00388D2589
MNGSTGIGRNITKLRQEHNLTQKELAYMTGISTSYLSKIEEGRKRPGMKTLAQIAKCLNVELQLLLRD